MGHPLYTGGSLHRRILLCVLYMGIFYTHGVAFFGREFFVTLPGGRCPPERSLGNVGAPQSLCLLGGARSLKSRPGCVAAGPGQAAARLGASEGANKRVSERAKGRARGRGSERASERASERGERGGERSSGGASQRAGGRASERARGRVKERASGGPGERASEWGSERASERGGE